MTEIKNHDLDPEALLYEIAEEPPKRRLHKLGLLLLASLALAVLYFWFFNSVLGKDLPKTAFLKKSNAEWQSKIALLNRDMDMYEEALSDLEMRNRDIYRSIFGMNEIPREALRPAGATRYAELDGLGRGSVLRDAYIRLDGVLERTYIQSMSYEEVEALSKRAGDMASCIPAIPPIEPDPAKFSVSSPFGSRVDPVFGGVRTHSGVDFSAKKGTPIYATGDGVIEFVNFQFFGYGTMVVIDHGFGYKTNYAHLSEAFVVEGMKIKRGECIGTVGRTGKATGDHLHYEVEYRGIKVNPANFYDLSMSKTEYAAMVRKRGEESPAVLRSGFRVRTR